LLDSKPSRLPLLLIFVEVSLDGTLAMAAAAVLVGDSLGPPAILRGMVE